MLRDAGELVEVHDDHFDQDTADEIWLREAGRRGWIVLTKDRHIRSNQIEVAALLEADVPCFSLLSAELTGAEMGSAFLAAMPSIKRFVAKFSSSFLATVSASGNVSLLLRYSDIVKRLH